MASANAAGWWSADYTPANVPHASYPAPQPAYPAAQPYASYPAQSAYSAPQTTYPASQPAYSAPQPAYPASQPAYPASQPAYLAPQPAYPASQPAYQASQPAYPTPPPAYPTPPPASPAPAASTYVAGLSKVRAGEEICRLARRLTAALGTTFPEDPVVDRARKRLLFAIDVNPSMVIDTIGGYLYKYKDQVVAQDEEFFLQNDYDAEIREGVDSEKLDYVTYIMPKAKEAWMRLDPSAPLRANYMQLVLDIFDFYLDYISS